MRRLFIFLILLVVLVAVFQLSRLGRDWHYVVPSEPGELLYATMFVDDVDDWEQDEGQMSSEVIGGAMRLSVNTQMDGIYSAVEHYFDDFDITVDTRAVDGDVNNGYGVIFRQKDRGNYYTFLISSDGYYQVNRLVDNSSKILSNWHPSPLLNQGIDAVNRIRVIGYEDQFQFFINGEQIEVCIPDNPDGTSTPNNITGECQGGQWLNTLTDDSIAFGRLGVTVVVGQQQPSGPVVEFDNVVVYGSGPLEQE